MSKLNMTDEEYLQIMQNLKKVVEGGIKFGAFDDDTIGDKDIQCNWGLCGDNKDVYPESSMHLWPEQFPTRIAPKYLKPNHRCPFEDPQGKNQESGCFYRCRYFQGRKKPSLKEWLVWFDAAIKWSGVKQ